MENASKALLIAGAILLSILIIGIGIAVFSNTQGNIDESMESMNEQTVTAFNSKFTSYQGERSGTEVKTLLSSLASNFSTYQDEPDKVPNIKVKNSSVATYSEVNDSGKTAYMNNLSKIRNELVNKHKYNVELIFGASGFITEINITGITKTDFEVSGTNATNTVNN